MIVGLSNISVSLNGIAFTGNGMLFGSSYVDHHWQSGGAVALRTALDQFDDCRPLEDAPCPMSFLEVVDAKL